MTDNTSGSAGQGSESPNPFSREGAGSADEVGSEAGPGYTSGDEPAASAHGATPISPGGPQPQGGADPYGIPSGQDPTPGGSSEEIPPFGGGRFGDGGGTPYGPPGTSYGEPMQPYGQPGPSPYSQTGANPYAQPSATPPYEQSPGYDSPGGQAYGGYGQPDYSQSGYGMSPYQGGYPGYGMAPVQHPQGVAALVTGILGLVVCPPVGIAGVVLGTKVRREIDADPQRYTGRGLGTAGLVLGIIGILSTLALVLLVVVGMIASSA